LKRAPGILVAAAGLALLICGQALFADGQATMMLGPVLVIGAAVLIWRHSLRLPALLLFCLLLGVDNPAERPADGMWVPPFAPLGSALFDTLNKVTGVNALRFAVVDVLLLSMLALVIYRKVIRRHLDEGVPTASCIAVICTLSLVATAGLELWGLATGGDFKNSLWQVRQIAYVPLIAMLFHGALRGPDDHRFLGGALMIIACIKTAIGLYFYEVICRPLNTKPAYVTTHSDSMLFVLAVVCAIALWNERRTIGSWLLCLVGVPIAMLGMIINNRRLAYVELAASLIAILCIVPWTAPKRALARGAILLLPAALAYAFVGWSSNSSVFRPVQIARSVISSEKDRSTQTRDIENFNLYWTLKQDPVLGQGFGHEYAEVSHADDISVIFQQYRFVPHNSLLGLWAFGGLLGFTAIWMPLVVAVYLARRSYARAQRPEDRTAALVVISTVIVFCVQAYGDMGMQSWEGAVLVGVSLAVVGKLAVSVGAWPAWSRASSRARLLHLPEVGPGERPA
jgi:O-antigen ligase